MRTEAIRDLIGRLSAEAERMAGWIEIEPYHDAPTLVGGTVVLHDDAVEFETDSGSSTVIAYRAVRAILAGRQGEDGFRCYDLDDAALDVAA